MAIAQHGRGAPGSQAGTRPPATQALATAFPWLAMLGLAALFIAVNLATLTRYPYPWVDEIQFSDPAVNWAMGHGFTSTAWFQQRGDAFFAGNVPLYSALLGGWLHLTGVSQLTVRSLNLLLMLGVAGGLAALAWRTRWVRSPVLLLLIAALACCGHAVMFGYRMGRYDPLGMLLVVLAAHCWVGPKTGGKMLTLVLLAALMPASGLQLLPLSLALAGVAMLWIGLRQTFAHGVALAAGLGLGVVGLWAVLQSQGVWEDFRRSTSAVGVIGISFVEKLLDLPKIYTADKSGLLMLAAALVLLATMLRQQSKIRRLPADTARPAWLITMHSPLGAAVALALSVPGVVQLAAKYPLYYNWMAYFALVLGSCWALQKLLDLRQTSANPASIAPWAMPVVSILIAGAMLIGLPLRSTAIGLLWPQRDLNDLQQLADTELRASDVLVSDFKAYYAAKPRVAQFFGPPYLDAMNAQEKSATTALLIRPEELARTADKLGTEPEHWQPVGAPLRAGATAPGPLHKVLRELVEENYGLQLYLSLIHI